MTWARAEEAWQEFLADVEAARQQLDCTWSNAWFRGIEKSNYSLKPSLLRLKWRDLPAAEKRDLSGMLRPKPRVNKMSPKYKEVSAERQRHRKKMEELFTAGKLDEVRLLEDQYKHLKDEEKELRFEARREPYYQGLIRLGERDAFVSYQYRTGITERNSWQVLAEMQHHKVPTRLLDWTDTLANGLYFALRPFRLKLERYWFIRRRKFQIEAVEFPPESETSGLATPALWILNPYYLARHSSERDRIWDLALNDELDYYRCFIEAKGWRFQYPIPSYSPWRNERIASQRGMFLVWGYDRRALEEMLYFDPKEKCYFNCRGGFKVAKRLVISDLCAVYAVKHIRQLLEYDRFAIYRDLDALGHKARREFLFDFFDDAKADELTDRREEDFD